MNQKIETSIFACGLAIVILVLGGKYLFMPAFQEINPAPNINNKVYRPYEDIQPNRMPILLEDLQVEPLAYRFHQSIRGDMLLGKKAEYIDSMADNLDEPTKIVTLQYTIWYPNSKSLLEKKEKQLQEQYGEKIELAEYDYGANKAYWLDDVLLLKYCDKIVLFENETTRELVDSSVCADFMRNDMQLETPRWYESV